jgi:hypothetical protein
VKPPNIRHPDEERCELYEDVLALAVLRGRRYELQYKVEKPNVVNVD